MIWHICWLRLAHLLSCAIQIGTDVLNNNEVRESTALLYSCCDIFASDYMDVPAADIPQHKIVLTPLSFETTTLLLHSEKQALGVGLENSKVVSLVCAR